MRLLSIILLLLCFTSNIALSNGMSGTEFWFGFMENQSQPQLSVFVNSMQATSGTISIPQNGWTQNFSVPANSSIEIIIPFNLAEATGNMSLENKGVLLVSNDPVFVSINNTTGGSQDASSIMPIGGLGYEYMALTYLDPSNTNWGTPEILIVAIEDNTQININLTGALSNGQVGPISVTLNRGQTYQVQSYWMIGGQNNGNDLSGSFIESVCNSDGYKHKIAVFSGDLCSIVGGVQCTGCDHLMEQMWPVDQLGTEFIVAAPVNRDTYVLKVAALDNGTTVNISGQLPFNLNAGQWQQFELTGDQTITSNLPIAVGQFTKGQDCSFGLGDPFFTQIIPSSQNLTDWKFLSYESGSAFNPFDSYVNIVVPNAGNAPVFLDGIAIPAGSFQIVGNSRVAKLPIPSNASTHALSSIGGFSAYVYGYGAANSYCYNSGIYSNSTDVNFDIAYLQDTTNQLFFDDTLCSCEPLGFISTFDLPGYEILWDFGDGLSGNGVSVNHDYLNGVYDVIMSIQDINGCKVDSVIKLNLVIINCDISGPLEPICPGENVVLSSVNPAFSYLWSNGETTQTIVVSPSQTTVYYLQLDGGAIPICDSLIVEVHEPMEATLNDTLICETESVILNIGSGFTNILWSTNETNESIQVNQPGTFTVQAIDIYGCDFTDTVIITTQAVPDWDLLGEHFVCEGDSNLFEGPGLNNASYYWNTGETTQNIYVSETGVYQLIVNDGVCNSTNFLELEVIPSMANYVLTDTVICADNFTLQLPYLPGTDISWSTGDVLNMTTVYESGLYFVTIGNQCELWSDSTQVTFDCSSDLYVPNAFTPDDDGLNDIFYAEGFGILEFEMMIFDRWGELIFTSNDLSYGWNGMYRGEKSQIGVYTYKIVITTYLEKRKQFIGHVSLVR